MELLLRLQLHLHHLFFTILSLTLTIMPTPTTAIPPYSSYPQPPPAPLSASAKHMNNLTDLEALLAFKSHVVDPRGILAANWTTGTSSFCDWVGVSCSRRRQRVTAIRLHNFSLQGTISPHLGNLSFLKVLDLTNNSLNGPIPESIGYLPRLAYLLLQVNSLTGLIPSNIFNVSSLIIFSVANNHLTGSIPSNNSFTMPPRLRKISLSFNRFIGDVLSSFLHCRDIQMISVSGNQFSGTIPAEIGSLSELTVLYLGGNHLTGTIPSSLGNLTKLTELGLNLDNFSGMIPEELGNLASLQYLSLSENGNIVSSIPTSLLNLSKLHIFDLSRNKLTGSVPVGIGKSLPMLEWFHVGHNQLSGGLEFLSSFSNCKDLKYLEIFRNTLEGVLPNDIGNLSTNLQHFHAFDNRIKGNIPSTLGNLSGLIALDLSENELIGTIPSALVGLGALQYMRLASNSISGFVPSELGLIKTLNALSLAYNKLFGPIPESLGNLSMLQYLRLDNNKLSASVLENLWTLENLLLLDLSGNNLTGSLPLQWSHLKALDSLNLSMNLLWGEIPSDLGELTMLTSMDLSKNSFQGQIPKAFGDLISATFIKLSYNYLSGSIPESLANLSELHSIDLSFNKLEGQVPRGRVFLNSSIPSLIGNEALCGAPQCKSNNCLTIALRAPISNTQLHIPPCDNLTRDKSRRKFSSLKYILPFTILGMVLLMFFRLMYAFHSRKKIKSFPDVDVPRLDHHRAISQLELVRATENFSEENLIGKGGFGSVFRGRLDDGLVVAIKVLNLEIEGSSSSFDAECQVLKMVRHKNLIKIISVCSNLDFKALILEYMPNGTLEQWLYSNNHFLNPLQRLNIMIDVSLALEHLHHHHPQVVLHCDLKPTNILLDEELVAHVSDFGIAKLLLGDSKSMATSSMPGTIGYIAPEYSTTGAVSRMSDVYTFGILLLETITKKKPVDSVFGEQSSLRGWICKAYPKTITDVVDKNILSHAADDDLQKMHRCLSSLIELGLLCSMDSPKERISMTDVVVRLQKIKIEYLSS